VNSPLVKTAIAGNDPNVGRLIMAVGNGFARHPDGTKAGRDLKHLKLSMGGCVLFEKGQFVLDGATEEAVNRHMRHAWLWESVPQITEAPVPVASTDTSPNAPPAWFVRADAVSYHSPIDFPPHQRCVEIEVDLACGEAACTVLGTDLTHEYVSVNADYRS
jgi:glutamate N-acetyltransferase / amino-acid N-acetyltransferase